MTLDGMVTMAKADQYTDEGKQTIEDARRTYKTGDISPATGLQKQPDGSWAPPKGGKNKELGSNNHTEQLEARKKADEKAKKEAAVKQQRAEGEANARAFQKKVESGEIKYNEKTGQFEEKSTPENKSEGKTNPKINIGSDVKVRVANGRPGKVTEIRGDLVTVEMPAQGDKPARRDQYYKSDLIATPENKSEGTQRIGINKQAAIAIAKKDGDSAFLMKNKDGEYAVVNSSAEFDKAEKMGYEAANEELHPREQVTHVRSDSATPKGVMSEIGNGVFNAKHPENFESEMASMGYQTLEFNDEYAVVSNNKGSQFQIKFTDHGDGRDFSAESMNLTYQDEDDDTDYDTEDSAPVRKLTADTKIRVRK